jgi:hypothetical protein
MECQTRDAAGILGIEKNYDTKGAVAQMMGALKEMKRVLLRCGLRDGATDNFELGNAWDRLVSGTAICVQWGHGYVGGYGTGVLADLMNHCEHGGRLVKYDPVFTGFMYTATAIWSAKVIKSPEVVFGSLSLL